MLSATGPMGTIYRARGLQLGSKPTVTKIMNALFVKHAESV